MGMRSSLHVKIVEWVREGHVAARCDIWIPLAYSRAVALQ